MAGRWFVHRNDQQLGPYSSGDIRQGLRDGRFDPFDLISREGSHVRIELMEVDEIFMHSQIELQAASGEASLTQGAVAEPSGQGAYLGGAAAEVSPRLTVVGGNGNARPAGGAQESPGRLQGLLGLGSKQPRAKNNSPKRFFLVDGSGKITGPLAASDIQMAWAKGTLDRSLMVQKTNSPAKVPVAKFVHFYAMAKLSSAGGNTVTSPMLSQMIRVEAERRGRLRQMLLPIMAGIVLLLAIALSYTYFKGTAVAPKKNNRKSVPSKVVTEKSGKPAVLQPPATRPLPRAKPQPQRSVPRQSVRQNASLSRPQPPPYVRPQQRGKVDAPPSSWRAPPTRKSANVPVARQPVARPPVVTPIPPRQPQAVAKVAPVQQTPQVVAPPVSAVATIGGATFKSADLDACSMKCRIPFTAKGEKITVVFFKGAFADQLNAKRGPFVLSGQLTQDANGKTLLLQQVK